MFRRVLVVFFLTVAGVCVDAQTATSTSFFSAWEDRVRTTSAKQPSWPIPVIAPSSQLVQLYRFDFVHEYAPKGTTTDILDNGKGLNLIPFYGTELDINLPSYVEHNNSKVKDGAGDFTTVLKVRPLAGNNQRGNYSLGFQVAASVPTGSYKNGTAAATVTPTLMGGKGFGRFAVQSTIGALLPTSETNTIGRTVTWNTTAQYRVGKIFWPEVEVNANYYSQGANDGKNQTFVSPGMMVSKVKFARDPKNRLALILGAGFQVATSSFHSYNHALVITSRFAF
jgi:hypothetical protein